MKYLNCRYFLLIFLLFSQLSFSAPLTFIKPDYKKEQPSLGPSFLIMLKNGVMISDDANRKIKIFSDLTLKKVIKSYIFPDGLNTISNLSTVENKIQITDISGRIFIIDSTENLALKDSEKSALKGEFHQNGINLTLDNEYLGFLNASASDRSIIDWEYIGEKNSNQIILVNETDNNDLYARIYFYKENTFELHTEFSWSIFKHIVNKPIQLSSNGTLSVIAFYDNNWSHKLENIIEINKNLKNLEIPKPLFFDDQITDEINELDNYINSETKESVQTSIIESATVANDYSVIDKAMLTHAETLALPELVTTDISREQTIARALAYFSLPFFYRKKNSKNLGQGWEKPKNLVNKSSTWQSGFRYYWSGYMTIKDHQLGIIKGHVVGDINTKTIIKKGIVGCDCSGCVSSWLGIGRHTTTGISNDTLKLFSPVDLTKIRPGDLLNKKGSHVRMLLNKISTPSGLKFRVIESAKSCDGVCIRTYSAKKLKGYKSLTYNKFSN